MGEIRYFPVLETLQTGSSPHSASYSKGTECSFFKVITSCAKSKMAFRFTSIPKHGFTACTGKTLLLKANNLFFDQWHVYVYCFYCSLFVTARSEYQGHGQNHLESQCRTQTPPSELTFSIAAAVGWVSRRTWDPRWRRKYRRRTTQLEGPIRND